MESLLLILFSLAFVNNIVLGQLVAVNAFFSQKNSLQHTGQFCLLLSALLVTSALINSLLYHGILLPMGWQDLTIVVFMLVISCLVLVTFNLLQHQYAYPRAYLPLLLGNSAFLAVSLTLTQETNSLGLVLFKSLAIAIGFTLISLLFAALTERLQHKNIPQAFQGAPIYLLSLGIVAMAFMAFH